MGRLEVELTPQHVQDKQFHDAFRGYNHEEVDRFLDEVAEAFAVAYEEREECRSRIRELESQLEQARSTEEILKRTLLHANKAADEAIRQARATSQKIVAEAERKAEELVIDAKRRTHGIVERAQAEVRELEQRADGLRRFEHDYRAQLRAFIDSQLRALSGAAIGSQRRLAAVGASSRAEAGSPTPDDDSIEPPAAEAPVGEPFTPDIPEAMEPAEAEAVAGDGDVAVGTEVEEGASAGPKGIQPSTPDSPALVEGALAPRQRES
jgi:cell division initiation protein